MIIAVDTSSLVAYLGGGKGEDVDLIDRAFDVKRAAFPPIVFSEILSDHRLSGDLIALIKQIPLLDIAAGYWERAGRLRARILAKGLKARLADVLIAQSCLDHRVPLITRDQDFRHFVGSADLTILNWS